MYTPSLGMLTSVVASTGPDPPSYEPTLPASWSNRSTLAGVSELTALLLGLTMWKRAGPAFREKRGDACQPWPLHCCLAGGGVYAALGWVTFTVQPPLPCTLSLYMPSASIRTARERSCGPFEAATVEFWPLASTTSM